MASLINRPTRLDQSPPANEKPAVARYILQPHSRTTKVEQFLLLTSIVVLPLQDYFPAVAGMSISFLLFAALAAYVIVNRPRALGAIWYHPVFISAAAFFVVSGLLEFSSPLPKYSESVRFATMVGGMVCVAALCRDRSALTAGLYGYIAAALWVSVLLYMTSYGTLQDMGAEDFSEADTLRAQTFGDKPVGANINALAIVCVQGAIVAVGLGLSTRLKQHRIPLLGIATFCLIASFLPMSRGAVVMSLLAFAVMFYARGGRQGKALIFICVIGLALYMLVPSAVWSRMVFSTKAGESGKMESRAYIYTNALNRLPEYIVAGIGAGNFHSKWGVEKGFGKKIGGVVVALGAHNAFLQITIFWGFFGLLTFLWFIGCVYRSIPLRCGRDELSLALLGILISLGAVLMQTHNFADKSFALGVGMLIGSRQWIWPSGIVSGIEGRRPPSGLDTNSQKPPLLHRQEDF